MKLSLSLLIIGLLCFVVLYNPGLTGTLFVRIFEDEDPVPTLRVETSDFNIIVPARGELVGFSKKSIRAPLVRTGALRVAWLLDEGTLVEEGDPIIRFDETDARLAIEESRNQYSRLGTRIDITEEYSRGRQEVLEKDQDAARLELDFARGQIRKDETIFSRWEIEESVMSAALAEYREGMLADREGLQETRSTADVEILEIDQQESSQRGAEAQETLAALQLSAPRSGILLHLRRQFEKLNVGAQVWSGEPILEIVTLNRYRAQVQIQERDIEGVRRGSEVKVKLDAFPGRVLSGRVAMLARVANQISRADPRKYFACDLLLSVPEDLVGELKPGLQISSSIQVQSWQDAILLPRSALIRKDDGFVVFVAHGASFQEQGVNVLATDYGFGVIEGLDAGQVVALRHPFEKEQLALPDFNALRATQGRRFEFEDR